ncbi:MAG: hypothetical protein ABI806_00545 [Candidatus Solibacter sp.]
MLLLFAPGAWISFGLPLRAIPFWARLLTGVALSPLIACGEFFVVRWAGLPFGYTVIALLVVNLPALYLIYRDLPQAQSPSRASWILALSIAIPAVVLMAGPLLSMGVRLYSPHTWVYSDPAYMLARGDLLLEDPSLAGIRMSYPVWPAMVFQTLVSYLLDSPPASTWVWNNLAFLIVTCGFAAGITRELGGGRFAQATTGVWLMLGTNPVGYILTVTLPGMVGRNLFGDLRYAPWVRKFHLFSTMPLGMALIAALLYLLLVTDIPDRARLITMGLLLAGAGFLYPLVFPPACGVFAAKLLAMVFEKRKLGLRAILAATFPMLMVLLVSLLVCYAEVKLLQQARQTGPAFLPSALTAFARKGVVSLVAMSVLLLGLLVVFRACWKRRPGALVLLLAGAFACALLHSFLAIPFWDNEYKIVYIMSMCLASFPALAGEQLWRKLGPTRAAVPLLAVAALLVIPYVHRYYLASPANPDAGAVDTSSFQLQLKPQEAWAPVCRAVRTMTPPGAVLVTQSSDVYFPLLANRNLYVPASDRVYPGVTLDADVLAADIRGNGRAILERRRRVLDGLFSASTSSDREASLQTLLSLRKPITIVAEQRHEALLAWLRNSGHGSEIYQHEGTSLWLIPSGSHTD